MDAKGRAFLPAVFRKMLQAGGEERLVLRKDVFQPCLVLYPESVWNEQMDALRQRLNRWNKQHQQVFRQFVSEVEVLTLDGNGRFLVPKRYLRMADIEQDVKFVGMGDTIEIWSNAKAEQTLGKVRPIDATTDYLRAVLYARKGNNGVAGTFLRSAIGKNPALQSYADRDLELRNIDK